MFIGMQITKKKTYRSSALENPLANESWGPLYIRNFEVAQMSKIYIPIDAEFYADFKNV